MSLHVVTLDEAAAYKPPYENASGRNEYAGILSSLMKITVGVRCAVAIRVCRSMRRICRQTQSGIIATWKMPKKTSQNLNIRIMLYSAVTIAVIIRKLEKTEFQNALIIEQYASTRARARACILCVCVCVYVCVCMCVCFECVYG